MSINIKKVFARRVAEPSEAAVFAVFVGARGVSARDTAV